MDEVLEIIGLSDRADERTDGFSGGMKRRLNIGIGLLNRPKLLVLDEPTVGVDPQSRNAILASVEQLGEQGMAILYTTHYMEEAERLCDRVGIIDAGQIKAEGTRRELVSLIGQRDRVDLAASGPLSAAAEALRAVPGSRRQRHTRAASGCWWARRGRSCRASSKRPPPPAHRSTESRSSSRTSRRSFST
jgi:ABC-2 type transport system ATP-binding protein